MTNTISPATDPSLHIVVRVGAEQFAFPVADVEEAVDAPAVEWVPVAPEGMLGQLLHRGRMIAAWDAAWAFSLAGTERRAGAALVLRDGTRRLAIVVDDVVEISRFAPGAVQAVPGGADLDGMLSGVCFLRREGNATDDRGSLVNIVRADALAGRAQ